MEQDLPEGVAQGREEVPAKGEWAEVGWEERAPELDPVGIVSAPIVGQSFLIRRELPAIT
jgi:hypothetical protein